MQGEFEESTRVITEIKQKLEQFITTSEGETEKEIAGTVKTVGSPVLTKDDREETAEQTKAEADDYSLKANDNDDKPFAGTLFLDVSAKDSTQLKKFQRSLDRISNLEVLLVDNPIQDKTRITVCANRPITLLKVLNEMALVTKAVADKEAIRVDLGIGDLWKV